MHEGKIDLHCVEVSITQRVEGGISLKGYGVIKVNKVGTIYLDFICRESSEIPAHSFYSAFPEDPFNSTQKLHLEAVTLDGDLVFAEEFSLRISVFNRRPPFRLPIFLHEVYFLYPTEYDQKKENYLYFELIEKAQVPANKMNSTSSTYGEESSYWNEAEIIIGDSKVSITNKNDRTIVQASGVFDENNLYEALLFYIGLSAGVMPQPYCLIRRKEENTALHLKSTHKTLRNKKIPAPFPSASSGNNWPNCHYKILENMLEANNYNQLYFNSSYNQWLRVWHAFNSVNNIAILTLGVAIEGLLNDIFIPALKLTSISEDFEKEKNSLIATLNQIKTSEANKESLIKYVERWGNIHAGKALSMLTQKGLVQEAERVAWRDLRNSAAHPKFKENTEARQEKEHNRISACLTLFYRLILNVFSYDGVIFEFGKVRSPELVKINHVKILE